VGLLLAAVLLARANATQVTSATSSNELSVPASLRKPDTRSSRKIEGNPHGVRSPASSRRRAVQPNIKASNPEKPIFGAQDANQLESQDSDTARVSSGTAVLIAFALAALTGLRKGLLQPV
jgi:hypothetical protein